MFLRVSECSYGCVITKTRRNIPPLFGVGPRTRGNIPAKCFHGSGIARGIRKRFLRVPHGRRAEMFPRVRRGNCTGTFPRVWDRTRGNIKCSHGSRYRQRDFSPPPGYTVAGGRRTRRNIFCFDGCGPRPVGTFRCRFRRGPVATFPRGVRAGPVETFLGIRPRSWTRGSIPRECCHGSTVRPRERAECCYGSWW